MQRFRQQLDVVLQRMRELPVSSRLLIGSLVIILIMGLFLVQQYAGTSSMTVLPVKVSAQPQAIEWMEQMDIPYKKDGAKLLVQSEQKYAVLAHLTEDGDADVGTIDFESLLQQENPFSSRERDQKRWLTAKMNVLSRMISRMTGVRSATVVIDEPGRMQGFGSSYVPPSASVNVVMKSGEMNQETVDAVARLVAGAHAGLKPERVAVTDANANRMRMPRSSDSLTAGGNLEHKVNTERLTKEKIESALSYIPGVIVGVNALVDTTDVTRHQDTYRDAVVGPKTERSSVSSMSTNSGGAEPGIQSNVAVSLESGGRSSTSSSQEQSESTLEPRFPAEHSVTKDAKGYALKINASIGVPRSFLIGVYRNSKNDQAAEPTDAELTAIEQQQRSQISELVSPLVDTVGMVGAIKGDVVVGVIPDFAMAETGSRLQEASTSPWMIAEAAPEGMIKTIGLGALAVVSLLMMFMLVKKAGKQEPLPSASELAGLPPPIQVDDSDIVGEADESTPALEGMELDDEALKRQQMLSQVNESVRENPDEAAALLRRWMKTDL